MRKRTFGRTGGQVGEIALGTWQLAGDAYGPIEPAVARATLVTALDQGVTVIETAAVYGSTPGAVEALVGEVVRAHGAKNLTVVTRVGIERESDGLARKRFDRETVLRMAQASRIRLGDGAIGALLLHNPSAKTLADDEWQRALETVRTRGEARWVGVSAGSVATGKLALAGGIDVIEVPYNLFHPAVLHGLAADVVHAGVGVLARSPLAYGLLTDAWSTADHFTEHDHRRVRWSADELRERTVQRDALRPLLAKHGRTMREAALRYALTSPLVSTVVVGARTPEQVLENVATATGEPYLTGEEVRDLPWLIASAGVRP